MPKKATLSLSQNDRLRLQNIVDRGTDWRERQRSKTLIFLDDGLSMREVSEVVEIDIRIVGLTRMDWLKRGFESLVDAPCSGAPKKITTEQLEKIFEAAKQEPLTAKALLFSAKIWQSTTAEIFTGFIGLLKEYVGKKITIIIDNASVHKAKTTKHLMKFTWMSAKCRDSKTQEADVDDMLDNFGSKYKFAF